MLEKVISFVVWDVQVHSHVQSKMVPFYQMKETAIISSTRQRTNKTKCLSLSNMLWCSSYGWNSCCHPGIYKSTYLLDYCVLPVLNFHFSFYQLVSGNNNQTFLTFDFLHLLMLEYFLRFLFALNRLLSIVIAIFRTC